MPDQIEQSNEPDSMHIQVKDHLMLPPDDECGYCGQAFVPDEVVIEKNIHGHKWRFCSEDCLRDFLDKIDFKDEDLDSADVVEPLDVEEEHESDDLDQEP